MFLHFLEMPGSGSQLASFRLNDFFGDACRLVVFGAHAFEQQVDRFQVADKLNQYSLIALD
jgi:hypothetical protein